MTLFPPSPYRLPDIHAVTVCYGPTAAERNAQLHARVLELEAMLADRDARLMEAARQIGTLDAALSAARAEVVRLRRPVEPAPNAWLPERPGLAR